MLIFFSFLLLENPFFLEPKLEILSFIMNKLDF